ncbi:DUF7668 domain-containing protein [Quadrisphaera granulorum]
MECWMRLVHGSHPCLTHEWRRGRALVTGGFIQLSLYISGEPSQELPPFNIVVATADPGGAHLDQDPAAPASPAQCVVLLTTTAGNHREMALHAGDVDAVIDALDRPAHEEDEEEDGPRWEVREVQVVGRPPADAGGNARHPGDAAAQLALSWNDVQERLRGEQMSLAGIKELTVRTSDFPAARAQASALSRWLRQAGAAEHVYFVAVDEGNLAGAVVEMEVRATQSTFNGGEPPVLADDPVEPIPEHLRPALRAELDALVRGERPEMMEAVEEYGEDGTTLVIQPEEIWDYKDSSAVWMDSGGWWVDVPLWTVTECPSELRAELEVDPSGEVTLIQVRVP